MNISSYLLSAIHRKKITQRAFAEMIDVTPAYLNKLCKGSKTPSIDMLDKICSALDMTASEFFSSPDEQPVSFSQEETELIRHLRLLPEHERLAVVQLVSALEQGKTP